MNDEDYAYIYYRFQFLSLCQLYLSRVPIATSSVSTSDLSLFQACLLRDAVQCPANLDHHDRSYESKTLKNIISLVGCKAVNSRGVPRPFWATMGLDYYNS